MRVFTIGFGTTTPAPLVCTPEQFGGDSFDSRGGGGFDPGAGFDPSGGFGVPANVLEIDEQQLKEIAKTTGGSYARAANASQLDRAFRELPKRVVTVHHVDELTVYLVAAGALLAIGALATSRWWNRFG